MKRILCAWAAVGIAAFPAATLAQDADRGITIVVPGSLDNLDPCRTARNEVGRVIKQNVAETLTELDPLDGSIQPRLALSWEQVGEKAWRFHLRQGVKYHDGSDFDAAAAAHAIQRTLNPSLDCVTRTQYFGGVTLETRIVDDYTLEIDPTPAQPILPTLLSMLAIGSSKTPLDQQEWTPVGTGPFVFESLEPGQKAVLRRFDGYWGDKPQMTTVTFLARSESAVAAAMVQTGEADLAPYIDVQDATDPETDVSYLNTESGHVAISQNVPPFDDVRVRKALNLAIDREAFVGTIFSKEVRIASQMVLPFINGYNPDLKPWPYDPEQAKALLAEARADGVPVDKPIILYGRPGFLLNTPDVLTALAEMWKAVGLDVSIQMIERNQFAEMIRQPHPGPEERQLSLFLNLHDNASGDAGSSLFFKYHSEGSQSETHDPRVDKLIDEGRAASGEERTQKFREAFRLITEDIVADVVLFHFVGFARIAPHINYTPTSLTNNELQVARITFKD